MSNVNKGLAPARPLIPAEVADAIEILREDEVPYSNENILLLRATGGKAECRERAAQALRSIPFDTLLAALVNGYERELTEEQRMARIKRELTSDYITHRTGMGRYGNAYEDAAYADGIESALDAVGVKIEGVNA